MSLRGIAHYGVPKRYFCTFGEKAQTRKRVSVIVPDNVISKAQLCAVGKLWIKYLNFGCKPKYNFDEVKI